MKNVDTVSGFLYTVIEKLTIKTLIKRIRALLYLLDRSSMKKGFSFVLNC